MAKGKQIDSVIGTIGQWSMGFFSERALVKDFLSCADDLVSVGVPFLGDYVGLRRNPLWKDTLKRNRLHRMDRRVVFADILNKINRSNGKVQVAARKLLTPYYTLYSTLTKTNHFLASTIHFWATM